MSRVTLVLLIAKHAERKDRKVAENLQTPRSQNIRDFRGAQVPDTPDVSVARCHPELGQSDTVFPRAANAIEITLTIPDELAGQIIPVDLDPSRQALEDMAVEAYRAHRLTGAQLGRVLGIPHRTSATLF
jgi:hypothetical protein